MKIGDLVRFCPDAWGTPLEDRALGIVVNVSNDSRWTSMITVLFPTDDIPYSSKSEDFEVVNENW